MAASLLFLSLLLTAGLWLKLQKGSFHAWTREQYVGRVVRIVGSELTLADKAGRAKTIRVSEATRVHARLAVPLHVGDLVMVAGSAAPDTGVVDARVIRVLSEERVQ